MNMSTAPQALPCQAQLAVTFRSTALLVYLGLFVCAYLLASYLPEQFFRDQSKLVDSLETDGEGLSSFRATATFYSLLSFGNPGLLVPVCAVAHILLLASLTGRNSALVAGLFLFVPSLFLNLIVLGKETLVIAMSSLIAYSFLTARSTLWPSLLLAGLYLTYGLFIRPYFLAMLGLFLYFLLLLHSSPNRRVTLALLALAALTLLPPEWYQIPAMHREDANNYALFRGTFDVRTMVNNVVVPTNALEFCINYLHSLLTLNFPVLFFHGIRDCIMTLTNGFVLFLIYRGVRKGSQAQRLLALLMLTHLLVLCLFEPDVGSYSRHLLSVSIYAATALTLLPKLRFAT